MKSPSVHPGIFQTYPALALYSFHVSEYNDSNKDDTIAELTQKIIALSRQWPEQISALPIISEWREIYRGMGLKPTKTISSIESLIKRARSGKWLTGQTHIDFYNAHSIAHAAPIGGYDAAKLQNSLILRFGSPETDRYAPLSGDSGNYPMHPELMLYASDSDVACWGLNHRDSALFCLDSNTRNALFVSEGITATQVAAAASAMTAMRTALVCLGHGCSDIVIADKTNPQGAPRLSHR